MRHSAVLSRGSTAAALEPLEARTLLAAVIAADGQPDLEGSIVSRGLAEVIVPGDTAKMRVRVANVGEDFVGRVRAEVFLSADADADDGPATDRSLGFKELTAVTIRGGAAVSVSLRLAVPTDAAKGSYNLLLKLTTHPGDESDTSELEGNQTAELVWRFGNFGGRSNVRLQLQHMEDVTVKYSLRGSGFGDVSDGAGDAKTLTLMGTDDRTAVRLREVNADDEVRPLLSAIAVRTIADDPADRTSLGALDARGSDLLGDLTVTGSLGTLWLRAIRAEGAAAQRTLTIGPVESRRVKLAMLIEDVTDATVNSRTPIALVRARTWTDNDGSTARDRITAPRLDGLRVLHGTSPLLEVPVI